MCGVRPARTVGIMTDDTLRLVRISADSGHVDVEARKGAEFTVKGDARVVERDGVATVDEVQGRLRVKVPAGTDLVIGTSSGRVSVRGPAGEVAVVSSSGRVEIEQAAVADVRTDSSRVEVGAVAGACRIRSTSGRVEVERCGAADVASETGRVELRRVGGEIDAHSVSGRIELSLDEPHDVRAETVTGRIDVSLPRGTTAFRSDGPSDGALPPPGTDCTVSARSETGKVVVDTR